MKGFIQWMQEDQPEVWASIRKAQAEGLVIIDLENDAVSATARLELVYPDLQEVINLLANDHIRRTAKSGARDHFKELLSNADE